MTLKDIVLFAHFKFLMGDRDEGQGWEDGVQNSGIKSHVNNRFHFQTFLNKYGKMPQ